MLNVKEYDEANELVATYVESESRTDKTDTRLDIITSKVWTLNSAWQYLIDVFLPVGFPASVTDDYLEYQIYDSLQAFSSSIAGLIASRAVLEGVGVGDASANPTTALLLSIVQETFGRMATILFAWRYGTALEPECKMYRLLADVLNDSALVIDCMSLLFPRAYRVLIYSSSSMLRALCGVAAGSSKASLSAHFAKRGNLGELNAKDASQETIISLIGMLAGTFVISWIEPGFASWITLVLLLCVHLGTNYRAVRAVKMRTLNRQRCNILFSTLTDTDTVLTPEQVSEAEVIFERDGLLRWSGRQRLGHCSHGANFADLVRAVAGSGREAAAFRYRHETLARVLKIFEDRKYVAWFDASQRQGWIVLKKGAQPRDQLQAWILILLTARQSHSSHGSDMAQVLAGMDSAAEQLLKGHEQSLVGAGWDLDASALETRPGRRVELLGEKH